MVAGHSTRWWDLHTPENEKKKTESFFIAQLFNCAMA